VRSTRFFCSLFAAAVFASFVTASVADAQPRRRPPLRNAPARANPNRRPPPPPPPPPPASQVEDAEWSNRNNTTSSDSGYDPFRDTAAPPEGAETPLEAPAEPSEQHPPRVDLELQYRVFTRSMSWDEDTMRALRPYDLGVGSAVRLAAEVYPLRFVTNSFPSNFAITGAYGVALGLDSTDARGRRFATTAYDAALGIRFRLPLDTTLPDLGISLGWTHRVFYIRASETQALRGVPDLEYNGVRVGFSARIQMVQRVALRLDLGLTYVPSTGELGDTIFPHVSTVGLDATVAVAFRIWKGLEARIGFDVQNYAHSANRQDGDRYVSTGANDRYLSGTLGIAWRE
jgi:hypothetical protein